jgi:hypothetical protein
MRRVDIPLDLNPLDTPAVQKPALNFPKMLPETTLLQAAYAAFNARDIDAALATMHPDVAWPNGMEGGYVHGHAEVRAYWTRQWLAIDPHVDPLSFEQDATGRILIDVHQVVRDPSGTVLSDQRIGHRFTIRNGLIQTMEICASPQ